MTSGHHKTSSLIHDFRAGDRTRFAEIYARIAPAVYAWASLRIPPVLRPRVDPEDLVQEVWVRALENLDHFDPASGPFRAWIFGIARHVLLKGLRAFREQLRGREQAQSSAIERLPAAVTSVTRAAAQNERLKLLLDAVRTLDAEDQALFIEHGLEGCSLADVAGRLKAGVEAVKKRWQRLRKKLERIAPGAAGLTDDGPASPP